LRVFEKAYNICMVFVFMRKEIQYLYHGSSNKLRGDKLNPSQGEDSEERPENRLLAVYATDRKDLAIRKMRIELKKSGFENMGKHDWKFFNKETYKDRLKVWTIDAIIDKDKMNIRQRKMIENIREMSIKDGRILILTGAYHLDFFAEHFKEAVFPYR